MNACNFASKTTNFGFQFNGHAKKSGTNGKKRCSNKKFAHDTPNPFKMPSNRRYSGSNTFSHTFLHNFLTNVYSRL